MTDETPTVGEIEAKAADRLTFFSDAIVAIAITLLALDLPVPSGETTADFWAAVQNDADDYLVFVVSFLVISANWFGHHRVYRYVTRVSAHVRQLNMLWLVTIVLIPFATRVLSESGAFAIRFTVYASVQSLCGIFLLLSVHALARDRAFAAVTPPNLVSNTDRGLGAVVGAFLVSIPVAWFTPWAFLCWASIPVVSRILRVGGDRDTTPRDA